jgi:hypothetical protein
VQAAGAHSLPFQSVSIEGASDGTSVVFATDAAGLNYLEFAKKETFVLFSM